MKIKKADETPARPVMMEGAEGAQIRLLIHEAEGAPNFYMRQFNVAAGGCTPLHTHGWEHEVYILAGSGTLVSDEGDIPAGAGDCVYIEPNERHQVRNTGGEELKFLCLVPK